MPRSTRPRTAEIRALQHLTGECCDLGDDPILWRQHWFAGIARLTDADLALGGEKIQSRHGPEPEHLGDTAWGWDHGFDPDGWQYAIAQFVQDPEYSPSEMRYLARVEVDDGIALSRTDVMADREWYGSADFLGIQQVIGVDHTLWCYHTIPDTGGTSLNGLILARSDGRADFTAREKEVIRLGHSLVAPLIGGSLTRFTDASPSTLPARVRQVLRCLLEGDGNKQIASRLGITPHTVNQYVKLIFRHFKVVSRAELLARWVRRRWDEDIFEKTVVSLPPRMKVVLRLFLAGEREKEIGLRLGLTRHTVNHYAKVLYAHFGVNGRSELLAHWIDRHNSPGRTWDPS